MGKTQNNGPQLQSLLRHCLESVEATGGVSEGPCRNTLLRFVG
jgi:hypothetical protein